MEILIALIIVVVLMVVAASRFHVHPFLSLLLAGIVMGFVGGLGKSEIIDTLTDGFGKTLGSIGIIIAFGTIIGAYLEKSGGAKTLANWVIKVIGARRSVLAMNLTGFIVCIPVYCDSGFIILSSLNKAISKKSKIPLVVLGVSLAAGLFATHVFVPPTPGPLAATAALDADLGLVILLGILVAIPVALVGKFWGEYIGRKQMASTGTFSTIRSESAQSSRGRVDFGSSPEKPEEDSKKDNSSQTLPKSLPGTLPGTRISFAPIVVPIMLIALKSIGAYPTHPFGEGPLAALVDFIGNPVIALLIGVALAFPLKPKQIQETHAHWVAAGLEQAGVIILITGAGGAFGAILRATGVGDFIGQSFAELELGLLLPFIIAAVLKTAQGSSTVAIITTAAIIAPILESFGLDSSLGRALAVLAIGAGSMTVSHINDSYFWVVAQFTELNTTTALKSQTVSTLLQGLTGIAIVMLLGWLVL
jgi:GntP family gluconate:H+ symporter